MHGDTSRLYICFAGVRALPCDERATQATILNTVPGDACAGASRAGAGREPSIGCVLCGYGSAPQQLQEWGGAVGCEERARSSLPGVPSGEITYPLQGRLLTLGRQHM